MTFNDNSIECNGCEEPEGQCCHSMPSLAHIANQLATVEGIENSDSAIQQKSRPEVVFVDEQPAHSVQNGGQIQLEIQSSQFPYAAQIEVTQTPADLASGTHFTVDPFAQEVDGQIPAMPILPVIDADRLTEQVIARQSAGDHHAWKLMASHPAAAADATSIGQESSVPEDSNGTQPNSVLVETEIVAACEQSSGPTDCFYAQPGQVIKVDGNQGFDHIDLRSYSIDDATFQPGAILLHTNTDPTLLAEGENAPLPITIRHRGIEFAVFAGDVRVDL